MTVYNNHQTPIVFPNKYEGDSQGLKVRDAFLVNRGVPMTLAQISKITGITKEGSIASRIRDLRALDLIIERTSTSERGVFEYTFTGYSN